MVERPEHFRWSSYRARAGLTTCDWLDADPAIASLANGRDRCQSLYRELVRSALADPELTLIRGALHRNQLTGDQGFYQRVETDTGVRVSMHSRGRPRKLEPETEQAPRGACLQGK
jgi:hypothetical protein